MTYTVPAPFTSTEPCAIHPVGTLRRWHRPMPAYTELHHVVPQAWQATWRPAATRTRLSDAATGALWDPRTVALCPTGHRNVHRLIVALMHAVADGQSDDPLAARLKAFGKRGMDSEEAMAYEALARYRTAGGSLVALTAAGQWGEA